MYNSIFSSSVENGKDFDPLSKSDRCLSFNINWCHLRVVYVSCDPIFMYPKKWGKRMLQIWNMNFFFTNEMEAKPPTHHKKGITSRNKVWTFDPVPLKLEEAFYLMSKGVSPTQTSRILDMVSRTLRAWNKYALMHTIYIVTLHN